MTTATTKNGQCCAQQAPLIIAGVVVAAGVAAALWLLLSHQSQQADPQAEIDRRISDLESSLTRLQDSFGHTTGR